MRLIVLKIIVLLSLILMIFISGCTSPTANVGDSRTIDNITVTVVGVERDYISGNRSIITGVNITVRNDQQPGISFVRDNFELYDFRNPFSVSVRPWWSQPDKHVLLSFRENMSIHLDMSRPPWNLNALRFSYNNKSVSWDLTKKE